MAEEIYEKHGIKIINVIPEPIDLTTEEEKVQRFEICQSCDQYDNGSCKSCGCIVNTLMAYKLRKCPLNKW
jgi:hypothetical protein